MHLNNKKGRLSSPSNYSRIHRHIVVISEPFPALTFQITNENERERETRKLFNIIPLNHSRNCNAINSLLCFRCLAFRLSFWLTVCNTGEKGAKVEGELDGLSREMG